MLCVARRDARTHARRSRERRREACLLAPPKHFAQIAHSCGVCVCVCVCVRVCVRVCVYVFCGFFFFFSFFLSFFFAWRTLKRARSRLLQCELVVLFLNALFMLIIFIWLCCCSLLLLFFTLLPASCLVFVFDVVLFGLFISCRSCDCCSCHVPPLSASRVFVFVCAVASHARTDVLQPISTRTRCRTC